MVDVEYQPTKKIIVHEIIKYTFDEFLNLKVRAPNPNLPLPNIRWAGGVVFSAGAYPSTSELVNQQVQGTVHYANLEFAEMEEYQPILMNQSSGGSVPVVNYSNNTAVADLIRWLKDQSQWFPKT